MVMTSDNSKPLTYLNFCNCQTSFFFSDLITIKETKENKILATGRPDPSFYYKKVEKV